MSLQYFLYDTDYNNTIIDRGNSSFSPVDPYEEIYIDFLIPETQPLYLYANSGGTGGTIIVNSQLEIETYLNATSPTSKPNDDVQYHVFTGETTNLQTQINSLSGTTSLTLQDITINAVPQGVRTTIEKEFKDTSNIEPLSIVFYVTLSGVNTILLRYWNENNSTSISDATIELIRVE